MWSGLVGVDAVFCELEFNIFYDNINAVLKFKRNFPQHQHPSIEQHKQEKVIDEMMLSRYTHTFSYMWGRCGAPVMFILGNHICIW